MAHKPHFITFGPSIPIVPLKQFSRAGMTHQQWADAWAICGPSVGRNMSNPRLELWQVIASAYLEGLQHGAALATLDRESTDGDR